MRAGTAGYANPEGHKVNVETFGELWDHAKRIAVGRRENLYEHLRGTAAAAGVATIAAGDRPKWLRDFEANTRLTEVQRQAVYDIVELANSVGNAGGSWFIADFG